MRLSVLNLVLGVTLSLSAYNVLAQNGDDQAREIMLQNEIARKADISEQSDLDMMLINKSGDKRIRKVTFIVDDTDPHLRKSFVKFISPANVKDTAFVQLEHEVKDNDRWLYLPALRKTRRISGSAKTDSFVGTDFSFEDFEILDGKIAGKKRNYKLLREEPYDGEECWVIEATPATEEEKGISGYSKRLLWISKKNYHALFTQFFDRQGGLFKELVASDIRPVSGGRRGDTRPYRQSMKTLKTGHTTVINFDNFILNENIDPNLFTRESLSRN